MFKVSYDYKRNLESHMMKNTEWGAVAYLSHSKYGKNTEVYNNNSSNYRTSCGGDLNDEVSITCKNSYGSNTNNIYNQTTTGNISGVFDMASGAYEYVMGYNINASTVGGESNIVSLYDDFFTNSIWNKYYDKYSATYTDSYQYSSRILGDATGELGPFGTDSEYWYISSWYNDHAYFVVPITSWFHRGGGHDFSNGSGIFYFAGNSGSEGNSLSFRVVLSL